MSIFFLTMFYCRACPYYSQCVGCYELVTNDMDNVNKLFDDLCGYARSLRPPAERNGYMFDFILLEYDECITRRLARIEFDTDTIPEELVLDSPEVVEPLCLDPDEFKVDIVLDTICGSRLHIDDFTLC